MAYNIACPKPATAVPAKRTKLDESHSQRGGRLNPSPPSDGSTAENPNTRLNCRRNFPKPVSGGELEPDPETRSNGDTESIPKVNGLI